MSSLASPTTRSDERRGHLARVIRRMLLPANPNRLVPVAEVPRSAVPLVEECLADAQLPVLLHEIAGVWGAQARIQVLVPARHAEAAAELVRGL